MEAADDRSHVEDLLARHGVLGACVHDIRAMTDAFTRCFRSGGKLLVCGNGGSAADAEHLQGELMKRYRLARPLPADTKARLRATVPSSAMAERLAEGLEGALPVLPLVGHSALMTAIANDTDADLVFAQQVVGYGRAGDALLAISTSGRSRNVVLAAWTARALGMSVVSLTGAGGGALAEAADIAIKVPLEETSAIQEEHLAIYHYLSAVLEERFFGTHEEPDRTPESLAGRGPT